MMRHRFVTALACVGVVGAPLLAGPAQVPVSRVGTGTLSGVVTTEGRDPQPVRRATVRINDGTSIPRAAGTDDQGRFVFEGLPQGRYTVSVSKPGFVETFHGSRRPGRGPGIPVAVTNDSRAAISIALARGAVITGLVTSESGAPMVKVPVAAVALRGGNTSAVRGESDDRGVYRLFGLAPGEYLVMAVPRLVGVSVGRGGGGPVTAVTDAEVQWALSGRDAGTIVPYGRIVGYAPVFFPGTTDAGAAGTVTVAAGEEQTAINLPLHIAPVSQIDGTITDANGVPASTATVTVLWKRRGEHSAAEAIAASGVVMPPRASVTAPRFVVQGLAPGEYTLVANSRSGLRGAPPPDPGGITWAVADLTITGADRSGVDLRLLPGLRLTGAFRLVGAGTPPPTSVFELSLVPHGLATAGVTQVRATMDADGAVRFPGIPPGRFRLTSTIPSPWFIESAILDNVDIADTPLDVSTSGLERSGLVVTFSDRGARVEGQLIDDTGTPVSRYAVVLFPADPALRHQGSRRVRLVQLATDGSFAIDRLPAGDYLLAAADDVTDADLDAALFTELNATALPVTLTPGQRVRHTLKITR